MSPPLRPQLAAINETQPSQYGLLHAYCGTVQHVLEACPRNYPSTAQLAQILESPRISPQMLGNMLSLLVELDVIGVYSDRNNGNRYDLTQYDPDRMQRLVRVFETASAPQSFKKDQ